MVDRPMYSPLPQEAQRSINTQWAEYISSVGLEGEFAMQLRGLSESQIEAELKKYREDKAPLVKDWKGMYGRS